jgi:predicted XRE-type DNA-binding protein
VKFSVFLININDRFQAIDKWLKKKEFKPQKQITEFLQRRQARIRDRIKETLEEAKKQLQSAKEAETEVELTESSITITATTTEEVGTPTIVSVEEEEEEEIMIID